MSCGKTVHCLECQGHSEGLYNQIMTSFTYYIFQTAGLFATKLGLIVQHHKPECPVENLDYCIRDQGHSEGSKCKWMFVWMISSEPQNILLPNLVW